MSHVMTNNHYLLNNYYLFKYTPITLLTQMHSNCTHISMNYMSNLKSIEWLYYCFFNFFHQYYIIVLLTFSSIASHITHRCFHFTIHQTKTWTKEIITESKYLVPKWRHKNNFYNIIPLTSLHNLFLFH